MTTIDESTSTPTGDPGVARVDRTSGCADHRAAPAACAQPPVPRHDLSMVVDPHRRRAIVDQRSRWVSGTTLRYHFFAALDPMWPDAEHLTWGGDVDQANVVRWAFEAWTNTGIGLDFEEVGDPTDAEIRIGFAHGDGSWSYLGRQILEHPRADQRTMNFGWDLTTDHGRDTALHEIGHTLGMPHEHQNPNAGIVWDEDEVIRQFAGPPNGWSPQTTRRNVIDKLDESNVFGSQWDRNSIMHYPFGPGLILEPDVLRVGLVPEPGLSVRDVAWVQAWYPPVAADDLVRLRANTSHPVRVLPGAQAHFEIVPTATRDYTLTTLGTADTVLVLFEEVDGSYRYLAGDDDSGEDRNARVEHHLFAGRRYVVRCRLYYSAASAEIGVVMF